MKILITNDDGINENGIIRLAKCALKYGDVYVVAPDSQRSAASHSITLRDSIKVYPHSFPIESVKAFSVSGSPADCVRVGALNIVPGKPDVVLSGINYGYNAGSDVQYSATVGAALEGAFQKIPSIALSEGTDDSYIITDMYLEKILDEFIYKNPGDGKIYNVNFPHCKLEDFKGILYDRFVSKGCVFKDRYRETDLPDGGKSYMIDGIYNEDVEDGSDLKALHSHYISVGILNNIS